MPTSWHGRQGYPPNALVDQRSDPDTRQVLEDWYLDRGWTYEFVFAFDGDLDMRDDHGTNDAADSDTATSDDEDTADRPVSDSVSVNTAFRDEADTPFGVGEAFQAVGHAQGEVDVRNGLKILKLPGGYYGHSVTRVGWLRRIAGDEYVLLPGARTIWRTGGELTTLDRLASHGPGDNHTFTAAQEGLEEIHRLLIRRSLPADERAWSAVCPKPSDWTDE